MKNQLTPPRNCLVLKTAIHFTFSSLLPSRKCFSAFYLASTYILKNKLQYFVPLFKWQNGQPDVWIPTIPLQRL
jgi:hypothetical protein